MEWSSVFDKKLKKDRQSKKDGRKKYDGQHWALTSFAIPGIVYTFIFSYLPMIGIVVAFKNYKFNLGLFGSPWNGLDNFVYLFKSNTLGTLLRNTLGYNLAFQIIGVATQLFFALMLLSISGRKWHIKIFQSSILVPYFLSWVVVSYISHTFLANSGLINTVLTSLGASKISFYTEPKYWPFILVFFATWKGLGYGTLLYYGSMLSIDQQLYEAAELDGCGYWRKHFHITLPQMATTITILTILNLGGIFHSDYGLFFYLPKDSGALYSVTDVLDSYIIRSLRVAGSVGQSSAIGFMQSIVGFVLVITVNKIVSKIDNESALF